MATTIITPEIFSDAVNEKLDVSLRVAPLAFDATPMVGDIQNAGSKVNFPTFKRLSDATEVVKGIDLIPDALDMNGNEATVKQVAKAVRVYDIDSAQVKGATIDNMATQLAELIQKKLDGDLVTAMDTDAIYKTATVGTNAFTIEEFETAMSSFGDNVDTDSFAGILIHSSVLGSLRQLDDFKDANVTYVTGGNGIVHNGVVGYLMGIPVIVCNNNTKADSEAKTYIIKKNALGYVFQKAITTVQDYVPLALATDIVSSTLYATKLIDTKGVCIMRKTVA